MKECGDCTLCCKLMGVYEDTPVELAKPPGVWCEHCDVGKGCKIYDNKPTACVMFECLWLQHQEMVEELKPNRSHVVMFELPEEVRKADVLTFRDAKTGVTVPKADVVVMEDPNYYRLGESQKNKWVGAVIQTLRRNGFKVAITNKFDSMLA